jgi:hypothetical protein
MKGKQNRREPLWTSKDVADSCGYPVQTRCQRLRKRARQTDFTHSGHTLLMEQQN